MCSFIYISPMAAFTLYGRVNSSGSRDTVAFKGEDIYYLTLYRKKYNGKEPDVR